MPGREIEWEDLVNDLPPEKVEGRSGYAERPHREAPTEVRRGNGPPPGDSGSTRPHLVRVPDRRLYAAYLAGFLGGALILANGVVLSASARYGFLLGATTAAGVEEFLGALGVLLGIVVMSTSIWLFPERRNHVAIGAVLLVLGALSFPEGGGFYVGLALTLAAAILALSVPPGPHFSLVPANILGCPRCGRLDEAGIETCRSCGSPLAD